MWKSVSTPVWVAVEEMVVSLEPFIMDLRVSLFPLTA
jgi:hypothetical protein